MTWLKSFKCVASYTSCTNCTNDQRARDNENSRIGMSELRSRANWIDSECNEFVYVKHNASEYEKINTAECADAQCSCEPGTSGILLRSGNRLWGGQISNDWRNASRIYPHCKMLKFIFWIVLCGWKSEIAKICPATRVIMLISL